MNLYCMVTANFTARVTIELTLYNEYLLQVNCFVRRIDIRGTFQQELDGICTVICADNDSKD